MTDPLTLIATTATAGTGALKALKSAREASERVGEALDTAQRVHKEISAVGTILDQELSFNCPTGIVEYGIAVQLKTGLRSVLWPGKLKFHDPRIQRLTVWSAPVMRSETEAVVPAEVGFEVHLDKLSPGVENIRLLVHYEVDRKDFITSFVDANHELDPVETDGRSEYWMSAQLRTLNGFRSTYGRIDLRDVFMTVDVAIQHDVKTAVPQRFEKQLKIQADLMKTTDRNLGHKLLMQNIQMTRGTGEVDATSLLASVQDLFLPPNFRKFLVMRGDEFRYSGVSRGDDIYSGLPLANFPSRMAVLSRTSLSLDNPSANGTLVYERENFRKKLAELFPRSMRDEGK